VLDNVWTGEDARRFLTKVQAIGSEQDSAFFALALDSGGRKGELLGLQWKDLEENTHGLRHTCATLTLAAGVPPHVVQRRLGHKSIEITLNLYAHVLPSQQGDAAKRLAGLLHR
jgi:integrase